MSLGGQWDYTIVMEQQEQPVVKGQKTQPQFSGSYLNGSRHHIWLLDLKLQHYFPPSSDFRNIVPNKITKNKDPSTTQSSHVEPSSQEHGSNLFA